MPRRVDFPVFMDPAEKYPVGSSEWAGRMSSRLFHSYERLEGGEIRPFVEYLIAAVPAKPWLVWPVDNPWGSRDAWSQVLFQRDWNHLMRIVEAVEGVDAEAVRRLKLIIAEQDGVDVAKGGFEGNQNAAKSETKHNDIMLRSSEALKQGTSSAYLLRRMERLASDDEAAEEERARAREALDGYRFGEHRSVRAAALHAGVVREPDPYEQLVRWWKKADVDQRGRFENYIRDFAWAEPPRQRGRAAKSKGRKNPSSGKGATVLSFRGAA